MSVYKSPESVSRYPIRKAKKTAISKATPKQPNAVQSYPLNQKNLWELTTKGACRLRAENILITFAKREIIREQ